LRINDFGFFVKVNYYAKIRESLFLQKLVNRKACVKITLISVISYREQTNRQFFFAKNACFIMYEISVKLQKYLSGSLERHRHF